MPRPAIKTPQFLNSSREKALLRFRETSAIDVDDVVMVSALTRYKNTRTMTVFVSQDTANGRRVFRFALRRDTRGLSQHEMMLDRYITYGNFRERIKQDALAQLPTDLRTQQRLIGAFYLLVDPRLRFHDIDAVPLDAAQENSLQCIVAQTSSDTAILHAWLRSWKTPGLKVLDSFKVTPS